MSSRKTIHTPAELQGHRVAGVERRTAHLSATEPPPAAVAERERAYRGVPPPAFGDPRPGRSALDQRKETEI